MASLIRATSLLGLTELVEEQGGDAQAFMARWHLPLGIARQSEAFLPYRTLAQMLESAASELDCPDIGMRLAGKQSLDVLGPVAVIARNAETVAGAFGSIVQYLHVHSPALKATLNQPPGQSYHRVTLQIVEPNLPRKRQVYELTMAVSVQILRLLAGEQARPQAMMFPHAPLAPPQAYQKMLHCRPRFEQDGCGFHIPSAVANARIDNADAQTRRLAASYLESQFSANDATTSTRVKQLIRRLLPTGQCRIETIAEQLAMHIRTLQRRLEDERERYEALVDDARREMAAHYLRESGLYLSQITGLLGYAEQSTFNRACRRWFGTTPRKFRMGNLDKEKSEQY